MREKCLSSGIENTSIYMFEGKSESSPNLRVRTFVWLEMMEKMMVKLISKFVE